MKKNVLITGANRGLGLGLVKYYLQHEWSVIACCREPQNATELQVLMAQYEDLDVFELDIVQPDAITELASTLSDLRLDLLINNAGYYGPKGYALGHVDVEEWRKVFEINTIAPLKVVEAFRSNLQTVTGSTVAFISSKMGSIEDNTSGGGYIYRSSKAALNAVVKSMALDLARDGIKVISLHPGWVQTDMGGPNALIDVTQSVAGMANVIGSISSATSGHFYDYQGIEIPW